MKAAEKISRYTHCLSRNKKRMCMFGIWPSFLLGSLHTAPTPQRRLRAAHISRMAQSTCFYFFHCMRLSFFPKSTVTFFYAVADDIMEFYIGLLFFSATAVPVCLQLMRGGRFSFNLFMHLGVLACLVPTHGDHFRYLWEYLMHLALSEYDGIDLAPTCSISVKMAVEMSVKVFWWPFTEMASSLRNRCAAATEK